MKYIDPITKEKKTVYTKASDTLPLGAIVDFDGEEIPAGWEPAPEDATVYIGPNEPTGGQDVWIQKGKNLYNKKTSVLGYLNEDGSIYLESTYCTSDFISVSPNTTYFKSATESVRAKYYDKNKKPLSDVYNDLGGSGAFAFTTPSDAYYLRVSMLETYSDTLQIEIGDVATDYEEYIPVKIYTKNDNGGYEEIYNEEIYKEVYSTEEQRIGTWIDGKPLYRKVLFLSQPTFNNSISHGIANIGEITNLTGSVNTGGEYKPITSVYIDNDNVYGRFSFSIYRFTAENLLIVAGSYFTENIANVKVRIIVEYTKTTD